MGDSGKVSNYTSHDVHLEIIPVLQQKNKLKHYEG